MDLIFTCYTKDNQQGCFRLSNWFSLRHLGQWMNHCLLHNNPLFSSHYKMRVWSDISYNYYFLPQFMVSCMKLVIFLLYNNLFIYQVLYTLVYHRHSLYCFLWDVIAPCPILLNHNWIMAWVINYLLHFDMDAITYSCPKPNARWAHLLTVT